MKVGWKEISLEDACEMYQPKTITSNDLIENGEFPVYGANGVIGRYNQYNHEHSQLIITCRGATCGAVNVSQPKSWITGNAMVVRPKIDNLSIKFLEYLFRGQINLTKAITGAAQPQITRQSLNPIVIPLPPLAEQHRIVDILDRAASIQRLRTEADAKLRELIPALFVDMFGDPVTNPKGWPLVRMQDIAPLKSGYAFKSTEYKDCGVPLIRISNLQSDQVSILTDNPCLDDSYLRTHEDYILNSGDLLIAMSGATTGKLGVVPQLTSPWLLNQRVGKFFVKRDICEGMYLVTLLNQPAVQAKITGVAFGAAQPNVSPSAMGNIIVPLPPISLQFKFVDFVRSIFAMRALADNSSHLTLSVSGALSAELM